MRLKLISFLKNAGLAQTTAENVCTYIEDNAVDFWPIVDGLRKEQAGEKTHAAGKVPA